MRIKVGKAQGLWHILPRLHWASLDAVAVMLAYQWAVARAVGVALPGAHYVLFGGGIWLGYTADRLLDVWRDPGLAMRTGRHRFHWQHRFGLLLAWCGGLAVTIGLGVLVLPPATLLLGLAVAGLAFLYVVLCSGGGARRSRLRRELKRLGTVAILAVAGSWWALERGAAWGDPLARATIAVFVLAAWGELWGLSHRLVRPVARPGWGLAWLLGGLCAVVLATGKTSLGWGVGALALVLVGVILGRFPRGEDQLVPIADLSLAAGLLLLGWGVG